MEKKKFIKDFLKKNSITICLAVFAIAYILIRSFGFSLGLSPDSTNYLREANALLKGYGFNNHAGAGQEGFFGIWPIGYPALIAFVALVTGFEVFYAAKIITVIVFLVMTAMFIRRFGENAWVYLLFFCNPGFIDCMHNVSSENLYLLAVLWFAFCCFDVWEGKGKENKAIIFLGISSFMAFMSRWVGAFTIGISGLLAILYFFGITVDKNKKKALKIAGVTFLNAVIILSYLFLIREKTGYFTGMYRIPSEEPKMTLLYLLIKAENAELNNAVMGIFSVNTYVFVIVAMVLIGYFIKKLWQDKLKDKLPMALLLTSFIYWCGYVYTRFQTDMEPFNYRVLLPSTLPIGVTLTYYILKNERVLELLRSFQCSGKRKVLLILVLFALCFQLHNNCAIMGTPYNAYETTKQEIEERYKDIPSGSLVVTEDWVINFLRMDLKRCTVNDCDSDSLEHVLYAVEHDDYPHVYIQTDYLNFLLDMVDDESKYVELRKYADYPEKLIQLK